MFINKKCVISSDHCCNNDYNLDTSKEKLQAIEHQWEQWDCWERSRVAFRSTQVNKNPFQVSLCEDSEGKALHEIQIKQCHTCKWLMALERIRKLHRKQWKKSQTNGTSLPFNWKQSTGRWQEKRMKLKSKTLWFRPVARVRGFSTANSPEGKYP